MRKGDGGLSPSAAHGSNQGAVVLARRRRRPLGTGGSRPRRDGDTGALCEPGGPRTGGRGVHVDPVPVGRVEDPATTRLTRGTRRAPLHAGPRGQLDESFRGRRPPTRAGGVGRRTRRLI